MQCYNRVTRNLKRVPAGNDGFWFYYWNFWKFKVALSPLRRIFLNFAKSCMLSCWLQFDNKKWGSPSSFLSYKHLKLNVRVFLAVHIVPMVTIPDWLLIPRLWHQPIKSGYNDPSNSKSWKVLETISATFKTISQRSNAKCSSLRWLTLFFLLFWWKKEWSFKWHRPFTKREIAVASRLSDKGTNTTRIYQ